ncbi:MAG: cytochrome ubiquinol oxidase subunit I [Deltaproteobacteria bacterium]|jgi:cytochrome d ubiquinol oxidase subunit I|nr:cytochrome ubiquinol oxidase subunit I [Deltaproteobacteria bacterium]
MDPIILSRLQFALATIVHFFFVPLTIGLGFFIAIMETRYVRTGDEKYKLQAKFWGKIFLINFVLGVVTGIALEFQFGTNWANYSKFVGDIFGSLLAIEATLAFFLESTFIAVWAFGWDKIPKKLHCVAIWLVAFASTISALWILLANGFMQNPVGYQIDAEGVARLQSFSEVLFNPYGWFMFFHTVCGAFLLCGFLVMGISAWHLYFDQDKDFFHTSFKLGSCFALCFSILSFVAGHQLGQVTYKYQPVKLAAMEAVWETEESTPMYLITLPKFSSEEGNLVQALPIPGGLSFLATNSFDKTIKGLKEVDKEDRPLVWPVFISFRLMVTFGCIFIGVAVLTAIFRKIVPSLGWGLWIYVLLIPLPYLTLQLGWMVTELGRQPWIVYGLLRTADAGSPPVEWYQVLATFLAMLAIYGLISVTGFIMMIRTALKGPGKLTEHYA